MHIDEWVAEFQNELLIQQIEFIPETATQKKKFGHQSGNMNQTNIQLYMLEKADTLVNEKERKKKSRM